MRAAAGLLLLVLGLCGLSEAINGANRDILAQVQKLKHMVLELQQENTGRLHINPFREHLLFFKSLSHKTSDLQAKVTSNEAELINIKSKVGQLEGANAGEEGYLTEFKRWKLVKTKFLCAFTEKPKVAFYAALTNAGRIGPFNVDVPMEFGKLFTNVGKAFNPSTGNETCYLFSS